MTKCLYTCWTHNGSKMQACMPKGVMLNFNSCEVGKTIEFPIETSSQTPAKGTIINCKYPECI